MNGSEKLNPVLIGKAACPTALKKHGVTFKDLGVEYFWNQKGWMTGPVFDLWLTDWNNNLIRQNRHVLLLIDNAPGHIIGEYSNISIQFLPPNTTAKLQPLDQGIIKSTKHNYRTILMTRYLASVESKQEAKTIMKSFDFVVACQVLVEAWDAVTPENIQKCFAKAGFMPCVEREPESYAEPPRIYRTICSMYLESMSHLLSVPLMMTELNLQRGWMMQPLSKQLQVNVKL